MAMMNNPLPKSMQVSGVYGAGGLALQVMTLMVF
jgi:hypothetical protein